MRSVDDKIVGFCVLLSSQLGQSASLIKCSDYRLNVNEFPRDRRERVAVDHRSKELETGNVLFTCDMSIETSRSSVSHRCKKSVTAALLLFRFAETEDETIFYFSCLSVYNRFGGHLSDFFFVYEF